MLRGRACRGIKTRRRGDLRHLTRPSIDAGTNIAGDTFAVAGSPVSPAAARRLLAVHYGLDAEATPLPGEKDANLHVRDAAGGEFLLKVVHEREARAITSLQTDVLLHVAARDPGMPVPRVVPGLRGEPVCEVSIEGAAPRMARLVTFMPGVLQRHAFGGARQAAAIGAALARLQLALADFRHPAADHRLIWDLKRAGDLRALLPSVAEPALRERLEGLLDHCVTRVVPRLATLRAQVVHNDLNSDNVLVDPGDPALIRGLIDFGDAVWTPLVVDVAVAAAYQLTPVGPPLAGAIDLIAGFHRVRPLQPAEIDILFDLILGRLVMRIAIAAWRAARFPDNRDYILRNAPLAWTLLDRLAGVAATAAADAIRQACGMAAR